MKKVLMVSCLVAGLSAGTVHARTLVWYHFNEGAVGETEIFITPVGDSASEFFRLEAR